MAGNGLCVISPVRKCGVFLLAARAHGKIHHGSVGSVVWDPVYDGISGTAGHAADEWMPMPTVVFVMHFRQTIRTDGKISGYHHRFFFGKRNFLAASDGKTLKRSGRHHLPADVDDFSRTRLFSFQDIQKSVDPLFGIGQRQLDQTTQVQHFAVHVQSIRHFGHKGPEADALDDAPDFNLFSDDGAHWPPRARDHGRDHGCGHDGHGRGRDDVHGFPAPPLFQSATLPPVQILPQWFRIL